MGMINREVTPTQRAKPTFFYGYAVVISAFFIMTIILGIHNSFGVFFKSVMTEFGWTRATTAGAFSLAVILQGLIGIFMGGLNDRFGPRLVLSLCGFLFGLGFLLMSQLSTLWELYLFYGIILGAGLSGVWVPLLSTVARWFIDRRALMGGIVLCGLGIGGLIIPPVAGQLISSYDWRVSYLILGSIALVVVLASAQFLRRDPEQMGQTPYINNSGSEAEWNSGTAGLTLKDAIKTRQCWLYFFMLFCSGFCMFGVIVHIVPHATDLGFSVVMATGLLVTINGFSIAGRIGVGIVADRIGNKPVFIISFALLASFLVLLSLALEAWQMYLFAILFGFTIGGITVVESPLVAELFGLGSHGLIYGLIVFGWTMGASVGPFMTGYIFDITNTYQIAFLISAAVGVLGLILTTLLRPIKQTEIEI